MCTLIAAPAAVSNWRTLTPSTSCSRIILLSELVLWYVFYLSYSNFRENHTFGFGIISIFNAFSCTSLFIAFKFTHLGLTVIVFSQEHAVEIYFIKFYILLKNKTNLQVVGIENFELLYWLKFIDLSEKKQQTAQRAIWTMK